MNRLGTAIIVGYGIALGVLLTSFDMEVWVKLLMVFCITGIIQGIITLFKKPNSNGTDSSNH